MCRSSGFRGLKLGRLPEVGVVVGPPRDLCEMSVKPEHYRLTQPIKAISGSSKIIWVKKQTHAVEYPQFFLFTSFSHPSF